MTEPAAEPAAPGYGRAAALYRKAGWAGVLPLPPGAKWPPPEGYTGRTGGWPSGPQIMEWAQRQGDGGLALRLPRGVIGIDVDAYGSKNGDDTLAELVERFGPLPTTWSSTSRGPGPSRIWLFRAPDTLELPGTLGPSIECIQHHHRYVCCWPSVVEGRPYRWTSPDGQPSGRVPRVDELAWLPEPWHAIQRPPRPAVTAFEPRAVEGGWSAAVARQHADGVAGLRVTGGRHDAVLPVVLALVRLDQAGHPGAGEALADLHGRFVAAIADRASVGQAEREWQGMVAGAADKVTATPAIRPSFDELRRTWAAERPLGRFGDFPAIAAHPAGSGAVDASETVLEAVVVDEEHGWELIDLAAIADGRYERPKPIFLPRRT